MENIERNTEPVKMDCPALRLHPGDTLMDGGRIVSVSEYTGRWSDAWTQKSMARKCQVVYTNRKGREIVAYWGKTTMIRITRECPVTKATEVPNEQ